MKNKADEMVMVGLMSGTSLDGLDIAVCKFWLDELQYRFELLHAETIAYSHEMAVRLKNCHSFTALEFVDFHREYGRFLGESVLSICNRNALSPKAIASHGHTIFHEPGRCRNFQLGDGAALASAAALPVIMDFRSQDVCLGGQGAPLVPKGDEFLFSEYDYRLNLGGFSNLSYKNDQELIAYDICPFNAVLNFLANRLQLPYDAEGSLARQGKVDAGLLASLNALWFYQQKPPKSLGREWVEQEVLPLINISESPVNDLLATFTEHAAFQIGKVLTGNRDRKVLITGGGAFNAWFIERLQAHTEVQIVIPDKAIIEFKEAIIFAFLGYLRLSEVENVNRSVTGAIKNSIAGAVYLG